MDNILSVISVQLKGDNENPLCTEVIFGLEESHFQQDSKPAAP